MKPPSFLDLLPVEEQGWFFGSLKQHAPRSIRLRPGFLSSELSFETVAVPWYSSGRLLVDASIRPSMFLDYAVANYYIQDAGSMLALELLDVKPNEIVCDLCAAPGGKASGIVERLGPGGFLLANEPIRGRCELLRYMLSRTGSLRYTVTQRDPEELARRFEGTFDAVLVDAPCSGQAMVTSGKRDENAFDTKQISHSAERQQRILRAAIRLLRPGGRLVYSTCTFAVEENEDQLQYLLQEFPGVWEPINHPAVNEWKSPIQPGAYRLWPHRAPTSGAFAFSIRMVGIPESVHFSADRGPSGSRKRDQRERAPKRKRSERESSIEEFGVLSCVSVFEQNCGEVRVVSSDLPTSMVEKITPEEKTRIAFQKGATIQPDHALALVNPLWFLPHEALELTDKDASQVVLGNVLTSIFQHEEAASKWQVAQWHGRPLGWVKDAGTRFNNHLPPSALLPELPIK